MTQDNVKTDRQQKNAPTKKKELFYHDRKDKNYIEENDDYESDVGYVVENFVLITEKIKKRDSEKQQKFRNELIEIYGEKCMVSGVKKPIEACHIIPFSECNNYDANNGLLLSCNIHKLFDDFDMSINPATLCVELFDENDNDDYAIYKNKKININKDRENNIKINLNNHYEKFLTKKKSLYL